MLSSGKQGHKIGNQRQEKKGEPRKNILRLQGLQVVGFFLPGKRFFQHENVANSRLLQKK